MKVIFAGPRNFTHIKGWVLDIAVMESGFTITEVVTGGAKGVDACAQHWAEDMGLPYKVYPADWDQHGRAAGPIRNRQMAEYADALIVVKAQDMDSPGTSSMIREAKRKKLQVHVKEIAVPRVGRFT